MKMIKVLWTKRPAMLLEAGEQQSSIKWLDTGTDQALPNDQIKLDKDELSYSEIVEKFGKVSNKGNRGGGPSKQATANQIVASHRELDRHQLIARIMTECKMSKAGATTYYYNATKQLKKG